MSIRWELGPPRHGSSRLVYIGSTICHHASVFGHKQIINSIRFIYSTPCTLPIHSNAPKNYQMHSSTIVVLRQNLFLAGRKCIFGRA